MPFQPNNKLGFKPTEEKPLDRIPLQLKLRQGVRHRIKAIPDWQNQIRDLLETWLEEREGDRVLTEIHASARGPARAF